MMCLCHFNLVRMRRVNPLAVADTSARKMWYGKDEPIRIEPRLLIENTALSNTAADPDTEMCIRDSRRSAHR